ncbi:MULTISPECIES: hypothetical protein [unclassified Streptomyces]|uniref:hypothetical protein n=1 Tax=unclassified Streptomyces TaxID=2593676 RepID=UPI002E341F3B|nr:hypothetical protein [Streptomyces sp. NBC_01439]
MHRIAHTYIQPGSLHFNAKVERLRRIDAEESHCMLAAVIVDDTGALNDELREWED